jgi:hypothetical protein
MYMTPHLDLIVGFDETTHTAHAAEPVARQLIAATDTHEP